MDWIDFQKEKYLIKDIFTFSYLEDSVKKFILTQHPSTNYTKFTSQTYIYV